MNPPTIYPSTVYLVMGERTADRDPAPPVVFYSFEAAERSWHLSYSVTEEPITIVSVPNCDDRWFVYHGDNRVGYIGKAAAYDVVTHL